MICKKCGSDVPAGNNFCAKCGVKVESDAQKNKSEQESMKVLNNKQKKKMRTIIVAVVSIALILGSIVATTLFNNSKKNSFQKQFSAFKEYCNQYQLGDMEQEYITITKDAQDAIKSKNTKEYKSLDKLFNEFKNDLSKYNDQVKSYANKGKEYKESFDKLYLMDQTKDTYTNYMNDLDNALDKSGLSDLQAIEEKFYDLYESCISENIKIIDDMKEKLNNCDKSVLFDPEIMLLKQYENEAEENINEQNYKEACRAYQCCTDLINQVEQASQYDFKLEQVDVSSYPTIKLYVSAVGNITDDQIILQSDKVAIKELLNNTYSNVKVSKVNQLDKKEQLNTCLVADVSGSMYEQLETVQEVMEQFVDCIQFNIGDKASLLEFDNIVRLSTPFTNQKGELNNAIHNICIGNCTALYDALYVAVCQASNQDGAKCVIAFTDGYDNVSIKTSQDVVRIAKQYGIPVYLIGIGYDVDSTELQEISEETGGFYQNVEYGEEMQDIYSQIYRKNKDLYLIEYNSNQSDQAADQSIYITYNDDDQFMRNVFTFSPSVLQAKEDTYKDLLKNTGLTNDEIEDEVLRIRKIYNEIVDQKEKEEYKKSTLNSGVTSYNDNGDTKCIIVKKGINNCDYTRYYYFDNKKLIFAYIEGKDSYRLYFNNDNLFRLRYAVNAKKFSEAQNHDNEDTAEFRSWEKFALDEAYSYLN